MGGVDRCRHFTCEECKTECISTSEPGEAQAERAALFADISDDDVVTICDDCWPSVLERIRRAFPEVFIQ